MKELGNLCRRRDTARPPDQDGMSTVILKETSAMAFSVFIRHQQQHTGRSRACGVGGGLHNAAVASGDCGENSNTTHDVE